MERPGEHPDDQAFAAPRHPALSCDLDYEQFLKDTEEKVNLNTSSIREHLQGTQAKMGDSRSGEHPPSPPVCIQWFSPRMPNTVRPVTTRQPQDYIDFLRALQQYLRCDGEGKEEVTLKLLLNLSAQCGVCFPCTPSSSFSSSSLNPQLSASSIHLVHTVRDDASLEFQDVWDDVRLQLRCHLLDRLFSLEPEHPGSRGTSVLSIPERVQCLQQLFFLYPESEVLKHYQILRSQSVQVILHSTRSSSPAGETGFDRLALGFHCVIPALTQALNEELQVLSGLVEPHTILGFLNAAYLRTVARELGSLLERECESALRDNTTLGSKIKKYSARSRATVVCSDVSQSQGLSPMELPMKNRSFSLTSHQLRALTQLACTLLGFERDVKELVTNATFIKSAEDTPCVKGILKKRREDSDMTTDGRKASAGTLLHTPEVLEFNWRSAFGGLVPHMEHCVKVVLDDVCAKSLQQEEASHSSGQTSVVPLCRTTGHSTVTASNTRLTHDPRDDTHSERETPTMTAKFCGTIVAELDALLPLAVACGDSSLQEVRLSFVEACGRAASAMLDRLRERALLVPHSAPVKNLPALLATCIYVRQRLELYRVTLKDSGTTAAKGPLTLLPVQKYRETADALKDQLTSYCLQVCSACILQDAESHRWADPKPFYEGERCSFSVQMWFYFLCGLRSDLWAVLPAAAAQEVLGQVLSETLQLLLHRYATARPSYQRHFQIRGDITAVLLYVEHLMWSLCESPEALVNSSPPPAAATKTRDWPYRIHSLCEQLLTVLVIVTAPLSLLYRTFMNNPAEESAPHRPDSSAARWLNAVNPDLFTERAARYGLMGRSALACRIRLLTSDPGYNPKSLLRVLLYRDCHLPRILLENSHLSQDSALETSPEGCQSGDDFIVALFNLLSRLHSAPMALTQALQPYLEGAHLWEHLYTLTDTSRTVPVVISSVRAIVTKSANSLLAHLVSMVMNWQATEEPSRALFKRNIPGSVLAKIPKEWNYTAPEERGQETATDAVISLAIRAMSFVFTNLPTAVASVPLPVRWLFNEAEKRLSQHSQQLRSTGLLLWALLGCLVQGLDDPDSVEEIRGLALDRGAKDHLSLLAECLQATMGIQQKSVIKPTVLKVLQALEEERPEWTNMQLHAARKLCSDSIFERERESEEVAGAELTEQKIGLMLLEVCHKAGGGDYLRQIYHIIQGNEELLLSKLSGGTDSPEDPPDLVNFDLGSDSPVNTHCFNPLKQFDHVGKKKLDQSAVVDWPWDWPSLLPTYQATSRDTFRTLLANRWEMQEGAELEDGEKAMVEELKETFSIGCCGPGPQHPPEADEAPAEQNQRETQPSDKSAA